MVRRRLRARRRHGGTVGTTVRRPYPRAGPAGQTGGPAGHVGTRAGRGGFSRWHGEVEPARSRPGRPLAGAGEGLASIATPCRRAPCGPTGAGEGGREARETPSSRRIGRAPRALGIPCGGPVREGALGAAEQRHVAAVSAPHGRREGDDQDLRQIVTCVAGPLRPLANVSQALHGGSPACPDPERTIHPRHPSLPSPFGRGVRTCWPSEEEVAGPGAPCRRGTQVCQPQGSGLTDHVWPCPCG